ncbi:MAG TPA: VTT domain-containing protein [Solirubrobacteraceae bacterium]|nr:VTT domain-containing protein [Solirubrobacteraceae bacterium]
MTLATIIVAAGVFAAIPAFRHAVSLSLNGNLGQLRHYIRGLGFGGAALLMGLILVHAVVPYPSEILTSTAGFVYGFLPGMLFALIGWTVVALLTYGIGVTIGRPVLRTLLGHRFTDLERGMESGGTRLMIVARLLPVVPLALLGYVAGATRESLWKLTWTSAVGYLPLTALVTYLGSQAKSLSSSNPLLWIAVVVIVLLIVGPHFWNRHAQRKRRAGTEPEAAPDR